MLLTAGNGDILYMISSLYALLVRFVLYSPWCICNIGQIFFV